MVGSILSNLWAALIAFSLYFGLSYPFDAPSPILIGSSIWAIVFFLLTYVIRYLLYFVWQAPIERVLELEDSVELSTKKKEQTEYSPEEIATVVKQMLDEDLSKL
ncbi:MAG: hypothetical protein ACE3JQ_06520 [Paenisporosarcina sp.]